MKKTRTKELNGAERLLEAKTKLIARLRRDAENAPAGRRADSATAAFGQIGLSFTDRAEGHDCEAGRSGPASAFTEDRMKHGEFMTADARRALAARLEHYERALKSIAANSCCSPCREAGLVAQAALRDAMTAAEAALRAELASLKVPPRPDEQG